MSTKEQKSQQFTRVAECLFRNGIGVYYSRIRVGKKVKNRSLKTKDFQIAKKRLLAVRQDVKKLKGEEGGIRFEELTKKWLASIKPGLKPNSYIRRCTAVKGLERIFKGMPMRSIGFTDIEEWQTKRGAALSDRGHNIELETLNLLFRYAINRGILMENPCEKFKRRKQAHKLVTPMTKEQFVLLVRELRSTTKAVLSGGADMIEFLAYSGLRVGEAREILLSDINLAHNSLRITGGEGGTKNRKERIIRLYPNLRQLVEKMLSKRDVSNGTERLFAIDTPRKALESACRRIGLPHFNVHSLRHFFATNLMETGAGFSVVGSFLGHQDNGVLAARTYAHLRPEHADDFASKMTFTVSEDLPDKRD